MTIPLSEYASRRRKLRTALKSAVGLVMAGDGGHDLHEEFRAHAHFRYLTGIEDEPGAVLLLDPGAPVEARREMLFLRPLDPEVEQWDGLRPGIGAALREATGIKAIFRLGHLPRMLNEAARRSRRLAALHPLATCDRPLSPDLAMLRRVAERVPETTVVDRTDAPTRLRSVKSRHELATIKRAIEITAAGFEAAMRGLRPAMSEFDVQELLEHAYRTNGSRGPAFPTIVGAGVNSTVLHYRANRERIEKGQLVCIDSGAAFAGYGADITRTLPAGGRFTDRQREVYEVVLGAQEAAIRATKPGVRLAAIDAVARSVITKAGYGDAFIHSIGHHLGLETHDPAPDEPLRPGAVITIEPGIYLPDEGIGIRIEDDVHVTAKGPVSLSAAIPKTVEDIERAMSGTPATARGTKKKVARHRRTGRPS
ncbi:MAG: aminopeptidase P N-terminal domain-containing protein [Planctomycetota bacterium]|jgi:Xaa-Pro aminopeptidase